ncbi:MAG: antibiotic biosynthesis monooxygenase [Candidatus Thiodiazotropha sp.]
MENEDLRQESDPPVSIMMSRMPLPGKEQEFETYLNGITEAAQRQPGHLGVSIIRPSGQERNYYILFKFDRRSNLEHWEKSDERARWRSIAKQVSEKPKRHMVTGLEAWFTLPDQAMLTPPPLFKMAVLAWLAIYLLISGLLWLIGPLLEPHPLMVRTLILTGIAVPLMTFLLMPLLTRIFKNWLYS